MRNLENQALDAKRKIDPTSPLPSRQESTQLIDSLPLDIDLGETQPSHLLFSPDDIRDIQRLGALENVSGDRLRNIERRLKTPVMDQGNLNTAIEDNINARDAKKYGVATSNYKNIDGFENRTAKMDSSYVDPNTGEPINMNEINRNIVSRDPDGGIISPVVEIRGQDAQAYHEVARGWREEAVSEWSAEDILVKLKENKGALDEVLQEQIDDPRFIPQLLTDLNTDTSQLTGDALEAATNRKLTAEMILESAEADLLDNFNIDLPIKPSLFEVEMIKRHFSRGAFTKSTVLAPVGREEEAAYSRTAGMLRGFLDAAASEGSNFKQAGQLQDAIKFYREEYSPEFRNKDFLKFSRKTKTGDARTNGLNFMIDRFIKPRTDMTPEQQLESFRNLFEGSPEGEVLLNAAMRHMTAQHFNKAGKITQSGLNRFYGTYAEHFRVFGNSYGSKGFFEEVGEQFELRALNKEEKSTLIKQIDLNLEQSVATAKKKVELEIADRKGDLVHDEIMELAADVDKGVVDIEKLVTRFQQRPDVLQRLLRDSINPEDTKASLREIMFKEYMSKTISESGAAKFAIDPSTGKPSISNRLESDVSAIKGLLKVDDSVLTQLYSEGEIKQLKSFVNVLETITVDPDILNLTGLDLKNVSLEGALSRLYSVVRGVVSIRFVASELLLRQLSKNQQVLLVEAVSNPKSAKVLEELFRGGAPTRELQHRFMVTWLGALKRKLGQENLTQSKREQVQKDHDEMLAFYNEKVRTRQENLWYSRETEEEADPMGFAPGEKPFEVEGLLSNAPQSVDKDMTSLGLI